MLDKAYLDKLCEKLVIIRLKKNAVERRAIVELFKKQPFCNKKMLEIVEVLLLTKR